MSAPIEALGLISPDAERNVLAAMYMGAVRDSVQDAVELAELLEPEDFHGPLYAIAFEAMRNLLRGPDVIDAAAIHAECIAVAETRGATGYRITEQDIASLYMDSPVTRPAMQANTVKRLAWLRRAGEYAFWMVQELQTRPNPADLFTEAQERWQQIAPLLHNTRWVYGWDTIGMHKEIVIERIKQAEAGELVRFDWPWSSWNHMIRPLRGGFVGILAAADGMGKTAYLEQIAEHWAAYGIHTVYVHLEDAFDYKMDRRTARHARVPINAIEDGTLDREQQQRIRDANERIKDMAKHLHYYDAAGETMANIVRELESRAREGVCQAVVFDYLDKVQPTRSQSKLFGDNTWERQANDMEALKTFAEKNRLPVMTATQGNKTMQNSGTQTRQAIQGSGQKSQKSQLVIILRRDIVGDDGLRDSTGARIAEPGQYSPLVTVRVDKQNRGVTGQFEQVFVGQYFSVADKAKGSA